MRSFFYVLKNSPNVLEALGRLGLFLFCLLTYYGVFQFAGFISVNGGSGWDGSVYLEYIMRLSSGEEIRNDPYRLMRVSGFLPAILMAKLGLDATKLIAFQAISNAVLLSLAATVFYSVARVLAETRLHAIMATSILLFSWPFLVMPVYYPILSDHLALFVSVMSIWAWLKSYNFVLYLLIFVGVWIMPGLFFLPLLLVALPYQKSYGLNKGSTNAAASCFVFGVCLFLSAYVWTLLTGLSDNEIITHPHPGAGYDIGKADLRDWSSAFVLFALSFTSLAWGGLIGNRAFWKVVNFWHLICGAIVTVAGFLAVSYFIEWSSGFRGPPVFYYMLMQSMAAPAKPLIAHFLYFGPVIVAAVLALCLFRATLFTGAAFPLGVIFAAYLPILILGSESRQWIAVFPIAVAFVASHERSTRPLLVIVLFSVFLCIPVVFLRDGVSGAIEAGLDFMSIGWQFYFGRQGPWMSNRTYIIGLVALLLFVSFYLVARSENTRDTSKRLECD